MRVWRALWVGLGLLLLALAAGLFFQAVQALLSGTFSALTGLSPQATWPYRFRQAQTTLLLLSAAALCLGFWGPAAWRHISRWAGGLDRGLKRVFSRAIDLETRRRCRIEALPRSSESPDASVIIGFGSDCTTAASGSTASGMSSIDIPSTCGHSSSS